MSTLKYKLKYFFKFNWRVFAFLIATNSTTWIQNATASEADIVHIRTLAASCAACHGTLGNPTASQFSITQKTLSGMPVREFEAKINAFKTGEKNATVMHHHAKGLNDNEIKQLAQYFSTQSIKPNQLPPQQKLEASHD